MTIQMRRKPFKFTKKEKKKQTAAPSKSAQEPLSALLSVNLEELRSIYSDSFDVTFRNFYINRKEKALLIYIEGLVDVPELDDNVLSPIMEESSFYYGDVKDLMEKKVSVSSIKEIDNIQTCVSEVSSGNAVILIDGRQKGLSIGLSNWETRSIQEPDAEATVRGPREGFVETIHVNTSMLRRKIRSPKLKMKTMNVGEYTSTEIVMAYMDGIVEETLLEEITNRIKKIKIDGMLDSGVLEELIEDYPFSPFPQILSTERPDVAVSQLLEGRVVLIVEGTPFALIVPASLYSFLQTEEDYYSRFLIATMIRWLRYVFLLISLLLPSLYVALITFHHEMIPSDLMMSMAAAREAIPFPALVEALLMEITFEALREAGLRLPKQIGAAVSIVGALVIGEAAVQAGIVSAPMVIVVALTGIASFTIPRYPAAIAIRMLRFPMIFLAGTLGLLGIMLGIITIIVHLCTIRSFGVPYLSPMAPLQKGETKDVLVRAPWWKLDTRPHLTGETNEYRQGAGQKPDPTKGGE